MDTSLIWKNCLTDAQKLISTFMSEGQNLEACARFSTLLIDTFKHNQIAFACGNGGSHCDAMHFAEEFTGRYRKERRPLGALALGDPSHITCVGNDYGFEHIFERQLRGLGKKGDLLLAISTSGNSKNVILAVEAAKAIGMKTVGLLGRDGGKLKNQCDISIVVPAQTSDRIQEIHIKIIHTVIETVERALFPENY
ncbi:MAG: D-sedoheptulose 7-phosphate isomerase [Pseudomonadota bacterium]|nr:D-sedoheptulose 7-phosphate isomerase [Pseudomonadota bacterium]